MAAKIKVIGNDALVEGIILEQENDSEFGLNRYTKSSGIKLKSENIALFDILDLVLEAEGDLSVVFEECKQHLGKEKFLYIREDVSEFFSDDE